MRFSFFGLVATAQVFQAESVSSAWHVVRENAQKTFPKTVATGSYSGITHLHDDIYAVVSDKSDSALFFKFRIQLNPVSGELEHVENLGFNETVREGLDHGRWPECLILLLLQSARACSVLLNILYTE